MTTPVDIPEIERLTKKFRARLEAVTGCKPDIDVWFHASMSDTRPLAHDAVACGYRVRRTPDHGNSSVSHITVQKWLPDVGTVWIVVNPRKAAK